MTDVPNMIIDYVEFYADDPETTQDFFRRACGWDFVQYGPDYSDIQNAGIGGGVARVAHAPPLIVLRADDLDKAFKAVRGAGAEITREIFDFPGGKRFEFKEPGGTAMAVWSPA